MKSLLDTNIFLEILLNQEKRTACETYLNNNLGNLYFSDFSLHSIGVILLHRKKHSIFQQFVTDVLPKVQLLSLPQSQYFDLALYASSYGLDFDDAYQFAVAKSYELAIVTMDSDFQKVENLIRVEFL